MKLSTILIAITLIHNISFGQNNDVPPTKGKSLAILGNSIMMNFSDNYPDLPASKGEHDNQNWETLKNALQLKELINCGIGGAQWQDRGDSYITAYPLRGTKSGTMSNGLRMLKRLIEENKRISPDIIIMAMGTNNPNISGDYESVMKMSFSELESNEAYRKTLFGGLRYSIEQARRDYPDSEIYLITPMQSNTPSRPFEKIKSTGDAIKMMGARYSCVVFDATFELGIVDIIEASKKDGKYFSDGVHLSKKGKEKYTKWLIKKILQTYY